MTDLLTVFYAVLSGSALNLNGSRCKPVGGACGGCAAEQAEQDQREQDALARLADRDLEHRCSG